MKKFRQLLAMALALVMVLGVLPVRTFAEEAVDMPAETVAEEIPEEAPAVEQTQPETVPEEIEPEEIPEEAPEEEPVEVPEEMTSVGVREMYWKNPLFEDLDTPEYVDDGLIPVMPRAVVTPTEAVKTLKTKMIARTSKVVVETYFTNDTSLTEEEFGYYLQYIWEYVFMSAMVHDGTPDGGDYLYWHVTDVGGEIAYDDSNSSTLYVQLTYELAYATTANQETAVSNKLDAVLAEIITTGMTDYEKVKAIYDYIIGRVTYDDAAVDNPKDILAHTAYGAMVEGSAVCDGYAVLFYRMCLEAGIDALMITGLADGNGDGVIDGAHAWNVVCIDGVYYNVDVTWDDAVRSAGYDYAYFLKCNDTFAYDHTRDAVFTGSNYNEDLPMATWDFLDDCIACGICGENVMWKLTSDGTLTLYGSGATYSVVNLPSRRRYLWNDYHCARVKKLVIEEGVTEIGHYLFENHTQMHEVSLPNSLEIINNRTFLNCTALVNLVLPEGLKSVGTSAFQDCGKLSYVTVPTTLEKIDADAFLNTPVKEVYISDIAAWCRMDMWSTGNPLNTETDLLLNGNLVTDLKGYSQITTINNHVFKYYQHFTDLTIPEQLTSIGDGAFWGCENLTSVTLNNVTKLGSTVFGNCKNLTDISLENVTEVGSGVLRQCSALESVILSDQLTIIPGNMFAYCTALKQITIPENVTEIVGSAFLGCTALESITLSSQLKTLGAYVFQDCTALKQITIPDSVTTIGLYAFMGCTALESVVLSNQLTTLSSSVFKNCASLKQLTIPASVTEIGEYGFASGSALEEVYFLGDAPQIGSGAFAGLTVIAYYPANNSTWTADIMRDYYGDVTWIALCEHSYEAVVTPPTCTEDGYTTHTCTNCGDTYTDTPVAATGHNFTEWAEVDGITSRTCQNEGCGLVEYESCAKNLTTGKLYSDLSVALGEAVSGDSVVLLSDMDATAAPLLVFSGVTLDLGGYSLRVNYLIGLKGSLVKGNVVDKNGENGAKLIVPQNGIVLPELAPDGAAEGYKIIPVWNGDHYIFSQAVISNQSFTVTGDTAKVQFLPNFSGYVKNSLFKPDGCEDNDVSVIISVSWMESGIRVTQEYFYTTSLIIDAMNNKSLYAYMTGCDTKEDLVFRIAIVTGSGAQVGSQEYVYAEQ